MTEQIVSKIDKFSEEYGLSKRETTVLYEMISGTVNAKELASTLGISPNTIRIHVKNINGKVGVVSKAGILSTFIRFN